MKLSKEQTQIVQLADLMYWLKVHLKSKGDIDVYTASCLDWESVVKDKDLIKIIKKLQTTINL